MTDLSDRTSPVSPDDLELPRLQDKMSWNPLPGLLQIWQAVVRRRWIIAGTIAGTLIAGLIITLLMTPQYTARTQIEISREQKNVTNVQGLEAQGQGQDLEFYQTQYALLEATSLAVRVAKRLRLTTSEAFFEAHGAKPAEDPDD